MDVNVNLTELREIAARMATASDAGNDPNPDDASRLAELVQSLDEWLTNGGFLPNAWER